MGESVEGSVEGKVEGNVAEKADDTAEESYQLFKTDLCGFCYRVRTFCDRNNIELPLRDTNNDPAAFRELLQATGRTTVPCLRIEKAGEVQWMFESMDIINYLAARHGVA